MPQALMKAIIVLFYVVPAGWVFVLSLMLAWRAIQSDYVTLAWLNPLRISDQYVAEQLGGKTRVRDAIYQDEMIVGRLRGEPEVDEKAQRIVLPQLIRTDNLEPERPFVFREWELKMIQPMPQMSIVQAGGTITFGNEGDDVTLGENQGRTLGAVHCRILRRVF